MDMVGRPYHYAGNWDHKTKCGLLFKWQCKDKRYNHYELNYNINTSSDWNAVECKRCLRGH